MLVETVVDMIDMVSTQHIKLVLFPQVALEHMVTGTALTPDTVSILITFYNLALIRCVLLFWSAVRLSFTM